MQNNIKRLQEYGRLCGPSGGEIFYRRSASIQKRLDKLNKLDKPEENKKLNITFDNNDRSGKDVLTITNLNLSFANKEIFNDLNLSIKYQDKSCLVGDDVNTNKFSILVFCMAFSISILPFKTSDN